MVEVGLPADQEHLVCERRQPEYPWSRNQVPLKEETLLLQPRLRLDDQMRQMADIPLEE